tara:strand:- start:192 stop:710 length:519 start_codon:yes stop_codon:yes gene_type:complete
MSTLKKDFYNAFEKLVTSFDPDKNKLEGKQKAVVDNLSNELTEAVTNFLVKQTFRITEMKSILEVEQISTAGPRFADVLPSVQVTVPPGITTAGMSVTGGPTTGATTNPMVSPVTTGTKGVLLPKLSLKKAGGQGGVLIAKGHAYIGPNPVGPTNEKKTKVKLMKNEIVGDK